MNEALVHHAHQLIDHAERTETGAVVFLGDYVDNHITAISTDFRLPLGVIFGSIAAMLREDGHEDDTIREALEAALNATDEQ